MCLLSDPPSQLFSSGSLMRLVFFQDQRSDAESEGGSKQRDDDGGPGANDRGSPHKKEIENKQHKEM